MIVRVPNKVVGLLLVFLLGVPQTSYSQNIDPSQIISGATQAINRLNPLSGAVNSLVDNAIDKGNDALAQRLEQLNGIIQSAIFNLNQILRERVQDLDQKVRIQRMEAVRELDRLSVNIQNMVSLTIEQLDTVLQQNITGFQNALSNSFASLPIPTEPLVNLGRANGLTVIANAGGPTRLFITGSGLFKDGKQPQAFIHTGPYDKQGTRLVVETASMGLVSVVMPPTLIPSTASPKTYTLSLGLSKGGPLAGIVNNTVWPSFPLTLCGALPKYSIRATLTGSAGAIWERTVSARRWFYVDAQPAFLITASLLAEPPWQVDADRPGFTGGLQIVDEPPTSPGGAGERNYGWTKGGYVLWVGGHGGNNAHAFAIAALKKITDVAECGTSRQEKSLEYNNLNQLHLSKGVALGSCDLSLKTPTLVAVAEVMRAGNVVETVNLGVPSQNTRALDGHMTLSVDGEGLLNVVLAPNCTQKVTYALVP